MKGGEARGLAWCPIKSKFSMGKQLIPFLDVLLHKDPKECPQRPVYHFGLPIGLWVASGAEFKMSAHLSLQG